MGLFGFGAPRPADAVRKRVEGWVRASQNFVDGTVVKVTEIACPDPACRGFETVILLMEPGRRTRACKVPKPMADVAESDVIHVLHAEP